MKEITPFERAKERLLCLLEESDPARGGRLPSERELCGALDVHRETLRRGGSPAASGRGITSKDAGSKRT